MDKNEVKIVRVVDASIERVFKAWVNADQMKQWYSPEGMTTPEASSDCREGGKFSVTMQMGEQKFEIGGEYLEYDEPNKIVFSWKHKGTPEDAKPTKVAVSFKKISEDKTELTLIHTGFTEELDRAQHDQGWNGTINKLDKFTKG